MKINKVTDGTWVTMITPFTADNKIDYEAVEKMIDWYAENNTQGLFAVCQSSEMRYLSLEERVELSRFVVEKNRGRMGVASSGHISDDIEDQIEELQKIAETNPDVLVLVANRLAKADEDEEVLKVNTLKLMEALPPEMPLGLYECPNPYHRLLSPELMKWLNDTGRFVFMKDTCCDAQMMQEKVKAAPNIGIFNADTATLLDSFHRGVKGYCGVGANFIPDIYEELYRKQTEKEAENLQNFLTVASYIGYQTYPVCAKYFLNLEGIKMELLSRSADEKKFDSLGRIWVEHLHEIWKEQKRK